MKAFWMSMSAKRITAEQNRKEPVKAPWNGHPIRLSPSGTRLTSAPLPK